jgi:tetratricopeptide (TPR) repeat protein
MRTPVWAREKPRTLEEKRGEQLDEDARRERLHVQGLGHLPVDRDRARDELSLEQQARLSSRPRTRRWQKLDKLDQEVDRNISRQQDASRQLTEAEARLAEAPADDAATLAAWLAEGEQGERPAATVYERTRDRDAAALLVEAVGLELDQALEARLRFVEKNREKMLAEARRDIDKARRRLQEAVSHLPVLREELLAARETALWCATFPDPLQSYGFGTTARVEYGNLVQLLTTDAEVLASRFSADQSRRLGESVHADPTTEAMWDTDERSVAWKKQELERARQLAEYALDPYVVAEEARDYRP